MQAWAAVSLVKLLPWTKRLASVGVVGAIVYGTFRMPLGELTFAQHVQRIWQTDEVIDLREGIATELGLAKTAALNELKARLAATKTSD